MLGRRCRTVRVLRPVASYLQAPSAHSGVRKRSTRSMSFFGSLLVLIGRALPLSPPRSRFDPSCRDRRGCQRKPLGKSPRRLVMNRSHCILHIALPNKSTMMFGLVIPSNWIPVGRERAEEHWTLSSCNCTTADAQGLMEVVRWREYAPLK